jgi:hypothetical protein
LQLLDNSSTSNEQDSIRLSEYSTAAAYAGSQSEHAGHGIRHQFHRFQGKNYTNSLVSNDTYDVFRCSSTQEYRDFTPPFACSFNHAAKASSPGSNGRKLLAVADEEGVISILDAAAKHQHSEHDYGQSHACYASRRGRVAAQTQINSTLTDAMRILSQTCFQPRSGRTETLYLMSNGATTTVRLCVLLSHACSSP